MNRLNTLQSPANEIEYATFDTGAARPNSINVGSRERTASLLGGGALVAVGLLRGHLSGLALAAAGALIARRGLKGHCDVYEALGVNTARHEAADPHLLYEHGVKIEGAIAVNKPARELYDYWRDLTHLGRFMTNVERVEIRDDGHSHWILRAPAGTTIEYDAEIINDEPGRLIAWRSVGGADIQHAGSVRFVEMAPGVSTTVKLNIEYIPPVGVLGEWGEKLLRVVGQSPENDLRQSLRNFKQLMETGDLTNAAGTPHA